MENRKKQWRFAFPCILVLVTLLSISATSCSDEAFTTSSACVLTFSTDSVNMDTVFARVPSSTRSFWVYNRSGSGLRCQNVRLAKGNQTGFRVNVDGIYLGPSEGFQTHDIELRNGDSLRVFVEVTTPAANQAEPLALEDHLVFTLQSGVEQRVALTAWAWDAVVVSNLQVSSDTTIATSRPVLVYGGINVESNATLRILGTTLYFHGDAGIHVDGTLFTDSLQQRETVLRGDRLDRMFDYLPYDGLSGQWMGIRFGATSSGNELRHTDIHSTYHAIVVDSADTDTINCRLLADHVTIHNCQGNGIEAHKASIRLNTCQISNTLGHCLYLDGGHVDIRNCTIAQFYPFDAARGAALVITNAGSDLKLFTANTLLTGYDDDVLLGERDTTHLFNCQFINCLVRTPRPLDDDSLMFTRCIFEDAADTTQVGRRHFVMVDEDLLRYDFRLSSKSPAVGAADPLYALHTDRANNLRPTPPSIGAYEQ